MAAEKAKSPLPSGPDERKREEACVSNVSESPSNVLVAWYSYRMAEEIDAQLVQMSDSLNDTVKKLNAASERALDPTSPVRFVCKSQSFSPCCK